MPVSTAIDLYLAKSVGELNRKADIPNKNVVPKVYVKTAEKLIVDANRCCTLGDEEKAYVLYMRYFNIITLIKKTADYKKQKDYYDSLIGKKNLLQAIEKAETLSKSLTDRYELVEAEAASKKLEALNEEREKAKKEKQAELEAKAKEAKEKEAEKDKEANGTVSETSVTSPLTLSASGLYQLIQSSPDQLIIMDARSASEFSDSHLKHKSVISVPVDIITPGITVPRIETSLPPGSRELWDKRAHMEYIVLMDWNSTIDTVGPGKTLQTLKDALFKFDSKTVIKSEPLILEGGYDEWCLYYPAMTTHPVRDRPLYTPVSNIPSLDFDYPDLDAAFIQTPSPVVKPTNGQLPGNVVNQSESLPNIVLAQPAQQKPRPYIPDRTKKPMLNSQTSLERLNNDLRNTESKPVFPNVTPSSSVSNTDVDRTPPDSKTMATQKSKSNIVAEQERELAALRSLQTQKQQELQNFQKEKERMALEHRARLEQLKSRQVEIEKLERVKHQQEKDVAELMRMRRRLEEEMRAETQREERERRQRAHEEGNRTAELDRMKQEEEARISRLRAVDESRSQRKLKEENEKLRLENLRKEEEAASIAEAEKQRLLLEGIETERKNEEERQKAEEEERQKARKEEEEAKVESQRQESQRKSEEERKRRAEILQQQEKEREELKRKEEERKRKLEEQRLAEEREKREQERLRLEKAERERKEKERLDKEKAEEARKVAEERLRRIADAERKARPSPSPSTMLPVGWERRLDKNTNRYFYLNHNDGTSQWDPPQMTSATSSPAHGKVYKTKLKDEGSGSGRSGGLVRSHSSPNIAQLVEEEGNQPTPNFNRGQKPSFKPLTSQHTSSRTVNQRAAARLRDLNPVYGSVGPGLTGLRNLGNTCYMNSTLQCLNNCFPLVSYFLNDNYLEDINREGKFSYNGEVVDDFAIVMKALWQKQYKYISAKDFKVVCATYNSMFAGTGQQDSQEFLAFLLDGLHEGLNRIKSRPKIEEIDTENMSDHIAADKSWARHKLMHESVIVELFQGVLKSTVTCLSCGKKSTRFDVFMYLTLPLPASQSGCSLQDCLRGFLKEERLTGSSQWFCPRCKVNRDAVKKLDIWKLPHILIIHLNRFIYEGMWREKKNQYVDFPVNSLDLNNIVAGPQRRKPYSLYAVSNHYGTMEGGHYTAYAKNPSSDDWHKFDDHEVYSMSRNDVKTAAAYFLFYTSI